MGDNYQCIRIKKSVYDAIKKHINEKGLDLTVPKFIELAVKKEMSKSKPRKENPVEAITKKLDRILEKINEIEMRINSLEGTKVANQDSFEKQRFVESDESFVNSEFQQSENEVIEIQPNDPNPTEKMMLAFLGESKPVAYNSKGLGRVIVEYGIIRIPYEKAKHLLDQDRRSKIEEEFKCSITMKVYDYDNYVVIMPKTSTGFERGDADEKSKLREWFKRNFRELMLSLIG